MGIVPLQSWLRSTVSVRAEVSIFFLGTKDGFYPDLSLVLQVLVVQKICEWKKPVYPVRASFPCVTVTSEPGVSWTYHIPIQLVQMSRQTFLLQYQLLPEPTVRLDGAYRKLHETTLCKRRSIGYVVLSFK